MYSSTDDDAQLLFDVGANTAIVDLRVTGPDGAIAADLRFDSAQGQKDITFDGPEPRLGELQNAYPPGDYGFVATTVDGTSIESTGTLSYDLLAAPVLDSPGAGDTNVQTNALDIRSQQVAGARSITFEIEPEASPPPGAPPSPKFTIDLPGDATAVAVPDGWLLPGTEYVYDIEAVGPTGNVTVTDARLTTR